MPPNEQRSDGKHAAWIAGRVQVLLSHYYQPDNPIEVKEAALDDWVSSLIMFPQGAIDKACETYIRNQPRRRPTPGDIRAICNGRAETRAGATAWGDKSKLSYDELRILEDKILPTARKWLAIPDLADHGKQTLEYWGEKA